MKSMIALALAGVVAMSTPVLVDAANINASKYAAAYGKGKPGCICESLCQRETG